QDPSSETIKIDTEMVTLDVTVIDQNNNPIYGLSKDDFAVFEDKVQQQIEAVSREEIPISFGIVIDTSGSMRNKLKTVSDAALTIIRQKRPVDEGFVIQFKSEPELVQPFTYDESDLESAIGELFTHGGTALLDAIINSSGYAHDQGKQRRKAIVVISDGLEKNSSVKEKEVIEAIKENEVQLYMIGFIEEGEPTSPYMKSPSQKARELLEQLAYDSGGQAFFPKDLNELPAIAAQIAKALRTQYVVSYYPSNAKHDGSFRNVQVDVSSRAGQKMIARTKQGYYAQKE
ncbi:MAG: VWA domain-containing protein, partial [Blastocatellia bacterium]|nr:VWA domain-containing protein [Blastocatellia bacterium]